MYTFDRSRALPFVHALSLALSSILHLLALDSNYKDKRAHRYVIATATEDFDHRD